MKRKTILLDVDNTLIIQDVTSYRMHPRWREVMQYDIILWSSCDYVEAIAELLGVKCIIKDYPLNRKPKADVLIDDCDAFKRDCEVKEYYKSIDDFILAQPDWMGDTERLFNLIKKDYNLSNTSLSFHKNAVIRAAGGGSYSPMGNKIILDQERAMNLSQILIHELAHTICFLESSDIGHEGKFEDILIKLKEEYGLKEQKELN